MTKKEVLMEGQKVTCPCDLCLKPVSKGGCPGGGKLLYILLRKDPLTKANGSGSDRKIIACQPPQRERQRFHPGDVNGNPICCEVGGHISLVKGGRKNLAKSTKGLMP